MKNLMFSPITILRADDTRVHLPAADVVPRLVLVEESKVIQQGSLEILIPARYEVDFTGVDLSDDRRPFVVTREIFDALGPQQVDFVTMDTETCVRNGLGVPHLIRRFIGKPGFDPDYRKTTNNQ